MMDTKRVLSAGLVCAFAAVGLLTTHAALAAIGLAGMFLALTLMGRRSLRATRVTSRQSEDRLLIRCITLFPLALGLGGVNQKAAMLSLVALTLAILPSIRLRRETDIGWRGAVILAIVVHALVIYRAGAPLQFIAAVAMGVLLLALWQSRIDRMLALEAVMDGLAIYLVASVVAYYGLGLRSASAAGRLGGFSSSIGVFTLRTFFPFAHSMVTAPVLASAYLCWAIPRMLARRLEAKSLTLLGCAAGTLVLLAAGYRVPIAVLLSCLAVGAVRPQLLRWAAIPLALLLLFLPFWWNDGHNPAHAAVRSLTSHVLFQRDGDTNEARSLGHRTGLWQLANEAYSAAPPSRQLLGWGHNGQLESGAANGFFNLERGFAASRESILAHSTAWQTLLDAGLAGLLMLVTLLVVALRSARSWCPGGNRSQVLLSPVLPLLTLIATSGTEVTLAPGVGSETFFVCILLVAVAVQGRARLTSKASLPEGTPQSELRECLIGEPARWI